MNSLEATKGFKSKFCSAAANKRTFLALAALSVFGLATTIYAGPLDSIPLGRAERLLGENTLVVPGNTSAAGLVGSDVYVPQRGWLSIAFAVESEAELTLMVLSDQQKRMVSSGQRLVGDPLARVRIDGPETANHTVNLDAAGTVFVAFVNSDPKSVRVTYRTSFKAY